MILRDSVKTKVALPSHNEFPCIRRWYMLLNKPNSLQDMIDPQASLLLHKGYLEFELFLQTAAYQSVWGKQFYKFWKKKNSNSLIMLAISNLSCCFVNILYLIVGKQFLGD